MEVKSKNYGTPQYKSLRIRTWKKWGVICEDFDMLYQEYIKTIKCNHCGNDFKSTKDRCLDHDHSTGLFRAIVCQNCNRWDVYIKYPNGYDKKVYEKQYYEKNIERIKEYREQNKEHKKEYDKHYREQKVICECGSMFGWSDISKHIRTFKHMNPFCDYPKTNIFM